MRALVIDDDPTLREMLELILRLEGLEVETAADGAAGLAAARRLRPDVILLDVMMPTVDGWAVADELAADPELVDVPVVFCTSKNSAQDQWDGWRRGAASYVIKPFVNEDLVTEVLRAANQQPLAA